jgi:hypothetical protein
VSDVDTENMFADVNTEAEVLGQMVGAGSTCWDKLGDSGVFDEGFAVQVVKQGQARLKEIRSQETFDYLRVNLPTKPFLDEVQRRMTRNERRLGGLRKYLLFGPRHWIGGSLTARRRTFFWGTHVSGTTDGKRWAVRFR